MEPTLEELQAAYNTTNLYRVGYTFDKAISCSLTKKCLVRIAINHRTPPKASEVLQAPIVMPPLPTAAEKDAWYKHGQYE
jgi:hypothetical protein